MIALFRKVDSVITVTLDNGGELADHVRIAAEIGIKVYFAKPYASVDSAHFLNLMVTEFISQVIAKCLHDDI